MSTAATKRFKKKLPKTWVFNGKEYKMVWRKPPGGEGLCRDPESSNEDRKIYVNPNPEAEEVVDTIIHESLHSELFLILPESDVERVATNIGDLLFACFKIEKKQD